MEARVFASAVVGFWKSSLAATAATLTFTLIAYIASWVDSFAPLIREISPPFTAPSCIVGLYSQFTSDNLGVSPLATVWGRAAIALFFAAITVVVIHIKMAADFLRVCQALGPPTKRRGFAREFGSGIRYIRVGGLLFLGSFGVPLATASGATLGSQISGWLMGAFQSLFIAGSCLLAVTWLTTSTQAFILVRALRAEASRSGTPNEARKSSA
jgi:hypothetical protein